MPSFNRPRCCRAYSDRTISTVKQSVRSWESIFQRKSGELVFDNRSCAHLYSSVKRVLSECPSDVEEERMAWQSIKKLLPDSCRCMEGDMIRDLAVGYRTPVRLPAGYLKHVRRISRSLFPVGWDTTYESSVLTCGPPLSGTTDVVRSKGGCLGAGIDHAQFLDVCLNSSEFPLDTSAAMVVVQSAGKPRPLTKFSSSTLCLKPLHEALYDNISKQNWLLRGEVTTDRLGDAGFKKGKGVLTSGDYKSATDGLSIEVAETILSVALESSRRVPPGIKRAALSILRPTLYSLAHDLEFVPSRGQMMGSYLSFPLLCIQNYIAFRYTMGADVPVLINGDDILFQSSADDSSKWMDTVGALGLTVEVTKTSVSDSFGTINSTLLRWRRSRLTVVKTLKFGMLRLADFSSVGKSYIDFVAGIKGDVRFRAGVEFFRWRLRDFKQTRFRPTELGVRGDLGYRLCEKFGLSLLPPELKLPPSYVSHNIRMDFPCVDVSTLSDRCRFLNACEMASWKFSQNYERSSTEIRYWMKISLIRPREPSFRASWRLISRDKINERRAFRKYAYSPPLVPLLVPLELDERLPPYEPTDLVDVVTKPKK